MCLVLVVGGLSLVCFGLWCLFGISASGWDALSGGSLVVCGCRLDLSFCGGGLVGFGWLF